MKKRLCVFTPTYNRAHLLHNLYESLLRQDSDDFYWLIIDDGSVDNTGEIVGKWIEEKKIDIEYCYKENGGLHTGYNKAIELMDCELSICIDSDDYLVDNGVQLILDYWDQNKKDDVAGIIGLDFDLNGKVIGDKLPKLHQINPIYLLAGYSNGDKKYVVRTDVYKTVAPMPVFKGEKNFNPHYLILKLCKQYEFLILNEPLCIVDYQPDGMSANIFKQYMNSPNSFAELRRVIMDLPMTPFKYLCKTTIHYVSSCLLAKQKNIIANSPRKLLTIILFPAGIVLSFYIRKNANKVISVK